MDVQEAYRVWDYWYREPVLGSGGDCRLLVVPGGCPMCSNTDCWGYWECNYTAISLVELDSSLGFLSFPTVNRSQYPAMPVLHQE